MSPATPSRPELVEAAEHRILGAGARYTPPEIWERGGVEEELARSLWLAMGFPHVPDDEASLTDRDLDALCVARELLTAGSLDAGTLVRQTRVMSQALSTVASAHAEALVPGGDGPGLLAGLVDGGDDPMPLLDQLLSYLYRRHLLAAVERLVIDPGPDGVAQPPTVVGFADLTDFTATAAAATEEELTVLVDGFASGAADLVAEAGGRVVKLIGDEVMFQVADPRRAAALALDLVGRGAGGTAVHVGMARGPVVVHHGDLFGSTVNTASRLSDLARPGTVLVDGALAEALGDEPGVLLRRTRSRPLKGVGHVDVHVLRRAGGGEDRPVGPA